jgi:hypothetical protein
MSIDIANVLAANVSIESFDANNVRVTLEDLELGESIPVGTVLEDYTATDILSEFEAAEIVEHFDVVALLDEIGRDRVIEYFDIKEIE